jgi:thymidylate synthase (FAD)
MKNTVELIGYYGCDKTHALSAWTSTSRDLDTAKQARVPALLKQLADAGHHTPFEKSMLHFLVRCDTASHIHLLKHRIGVSINGESARYKELKDPTGFAPVDWPSGLALKLEEHFERSTELYRAALVAMEAHGISRKRAKESARLFLPYSNQLTLDVSFNWRSFHHFLGLRNKPDAQREIQEIASQMLEQIRLIDGAPFRHTIAAFGH